MLSLIFFSIIYMYINIFQLIFIFTKFGMSYYLRQRCNLWRNFLAQVTIDHYSINCTIKISLCKEYYVFGYYSYVATLQPKLIVFFFVNNSILSCKYSQSLTNLRFNSMITYTHLLIKNNIIHLIIADILDALIFVILEKSTF